MSGEVFLDGRVVLHCGDSREVLKGIPDNSIDSIVTDPPYALVSIVKRFANGAPVKVPEGGSGAYARASAGFMGKSWDTGETAFVVEFWAECLRVLKPGGHVVAFSGTRTYHRIACAIEDSGFEVRDMLSWLYGSGFPKSHDVSKGIDKAMGAERAKVRVDASRVRNPKATGAGRDGMEGASRPWIESAMARGFHEAVSDEAVSDEAVSDEAVSDEAVEWQGWGTALKPACEPICFGRKPLVGTVAANVLLHGTGAINIDSCRVGSESRSRSTGEKISENLSMGGGNYSREIVGTVEGRWPANVLHDGGADVLAAFPAESSTTGVRTYRSKAASVVGTQWLSDNHESQEHTDSGSPSRFFYTAKADSHDRIGSKHPTVKPVDLMQWLCRLVTPPGGTVLDPFAGSGTTGEAAFREGFKAVLVEREPEYQADIRRRLALCLAGPEERKRESIKAKHGDIPFEKGSLFAELNQPADPSTPPTTGTADLRRLRGRTIGPIGMKR